MKISFIFSLAILAAPQTASPQDAVVKIYTVRPGGANQGSGFFSSDQGQVITAYHVIQGATGIEIVHDRLGTFSDVRVDFISPSYDVAVLQVLSTIVKTPYLKLSDAPPGLGDRLDTEGYPRNGARQHFTPRTTSEGFVDSYSIRNERGRRLFNERIDVVTLDLTIYSGMSGAPVWGPSGAIGILSGSYQEGGGIAWAIPSRYLSSLQKIGKQPNAVGSWPALTLMSEAWQNLRSVVRLNASAAAIYDEYVESVEAVARLYSQVSEYSNVAHTDFIAFRPFLERVATDPALGSNRDAASAYLDMPSEKSRESFTQAVDAFTALGAAGRRLEAAMAGLMSWITEESNIPDSEGEKLVKKLRVIRDQYGDLSSGIEKSLGIDMDALTNSAADLGKELQGATPAQEAGAKIRYIDVWLPALEAFGSFNALTFMSRDISKYRKVAQLFEPVVYQRVSNQ